MRISLAIALLAVSGSAARAEGREAASPDVATALVFGGTAATLPLVLCALTADGDRTREVCGGLALTTALVGPSLGRWYARDPAWAGLVTRGLGMGLFVAAGRAAGDEEPPMLLLAPGALLVVGATIYDLYMTPRSVRARNMVVVPTVTQGTGAGIAMAGTF